MYTTARACYTSSNHGQENTIAINITSITNTITIATADITTTAIVPNAALDTYISSVVIIFTIASFLASPPIVNLIMDILRRQPNRSISGF